MFQGLQTKSWTGADRTQAVLNAGSDWQLALAKFASLVHINTTVLAQDPDCYFRVPAPLATRQCLVFPIYRNPNNKHAFWGYVKSLLLELVFLLRSKPAYQIVVLCNDRWLIGETDPYWDICQERDRQEDRDAVEFHQLGDIVSLFNFLRRERNISFLPWEGYFPEACIAEAIYRDDALAHCSHYLRCDADVLWPGNRPFMFTADIGFSHYYQKSTYDVLQRRLKYFFGDFARDYSSTEVYLSHLYQRVPPAEPWRYFCMSYVSREYFPVFQEQMHAFEADKLTNAKQGELVLTLLQDCTTEVATITGSVTNNYCDFIQQGLSLRLADRQVVNYSRITVSDTKGLIQTMESKLPLRFLEQNIPEIDFSPLHARLLETR